MNTKILSNRALSVIDQYRHFTIGTAVTSVPYFNNKTLRARGALRIYTGKGSPKDIFEEVESVMTKNHFPAEQMSDETLKKLLVDQNIGIDCSGFAYYILNAESEEMGKGSIDKHISFVNCTGIIGKIRCSLRPIENCDVATLAHNKNSRVIENKEIQPGDVITMTSTGNDEFDNEREHILIIHQVDYQNFTPFKLYYSHAVAYPEDGIYGTGIKQGAIDIPEINKPVTDGHWIENDVEGVNNRIFIRAQKSKTEVRRLRWM
jgi:hypothetical protein